MKYDKIIRRLENHTVSADFHCVFIRGAKTEKECDPKIRAAEKKSGRPATDVVWIRRASDVVKK